MIAVSKTKPRGVLWLPASLGYSGFLLMLLAVIFAVVNGNFLQEGALLMEMPWGIVSLVDIYLGLILFSVWVTWREENKLTALTWSVFILLLGNMVSCLYVLKAVSEARGDIIKFWLGRHIAHAD